jgi:uracil-xanthine permease
VPLWAATGDGRWLAGRPLVGRFAEPYERPGWPHTVGFGLQHVLAVAGATLLVPVLTGFPISATLLFSGLGTLLFLLVTRNRLPAYLGPSMAFIAPLQAAQGSGLAAQLGGVLVVGMVLTAVGVAVKALGPRVVELLMPPVVTGAVVMLIGLSLTPGAFDSIAAQPLIAALSLLAVVVAAGLLPGAAGRLSVLIGVLVGWLVATFSGGLDAARVEALRAADWVGLPQLTSPQIRPSVVLAVLPLVIVLIAENIGHMKAIGAVTGRHVDPLASDTLIAAGLGTTLGGLGGGCGATTRPENIGVMAASRVYSTAPFVVAALAAIALSGSPKFAALLLTVPVGVIGGVGLVLYALIAIAGARVWLDNRVDLTDPVTLLIAALALVAGVASVTITVGDVQLGGVTWGSIVIVLLYPVLRAVRRRVGVRGTEVPPPAPVRRRGSGPRWQVGQK